MFRVGFISILLCGVPFALTATTQDKNEDKEILKLQTELKQALKAIETRDVLILTLQNQVQALKAEAIAERNKAEALAARAESLLKQVQELSKSVAAGKLLEKPGVVDRKDLNPPDIQLKGKVIKLVDKSPDLVVIDVGADDGLKVNHTLECFRLTPPTYLGTLRIIEVQPRSAIARIQRRGPAPVVNLREGDAVATQLK